MNSTTKIAVRTHFLADLSSVWNALISPHAIVRWNFAIREWHGAKAVCNSVLDDGRTVEVCLQKHGRGVDAVQPNQAEGTNPAELQWQGWLAILNNFKADVESVA